MCQPHDGNDHPWLADVRILLAQLEQLPKHVLVSVVQQCLRHLRCHRREPLHIELECLVRTMPSELALQPCSITVNTRHCGCRWSLIRVRMRILSLAS